jgi:hypothetical protein
MDEEKIVEGIRRLSEAIQEVQAANPVNGQ